jgi:hypothetical protein
MKITVKPARGLQAFAILVGLGSPVAAQSLICVRPAPQAAGCKLKLSSAKPKELLAFRLFKDTSRTRPDSGAVVLFNLVSGSGTITASAVTNAAGLVVAEYAGEDITTEVVITARRMDAAIAQAEVRLTPADRPLRSDWTLGNIVGDHQAWYAERQLKEPIEAPIVGPTEAQCDSVAVRFKANTELSAIAPDTARAKWVNQRCIASARFRLGKEVGEQFARVELIGSSAAPRTISARARLAPRFMVGALATASPAKDDILKDTVTIDSMPAHWRSSPLLGVDWAPVLTWPNLRTVFAINPLDARHEWFAGLSALQLGSAQREGVGFDLQGGVTIRRPNIIKDRAACAANVKTCQAERQWRFGAGFVFAVDAITLLGDFKGFFPLK